VSGWIGVDLDGTLAEYGGWKGKDHIGAPVAAMAFRVRQWLAEDRDVRIFTARVSGPREGNEIEESRTLIQDWTERHFGKRLAVTCTKDFGMIELWDDRVVQIECNTGRRMDGQL